MLQKPERFKGCSQSGKRDISKWHIAHLDPLLLINPYKAGINPSIATVICHFTAVLREFYILQNAGLYRTWFWLALNWYYWPLNSRLIGKVDLCLYFGELSTQFIRELSPCCSQSSWKEAAPIRTRDAMIDSWMHGEEQSWISFITCCKRRSLWRTRIS